MTFELGGLPLKDLIDRTNCYLDHLASGWLQSQKVDAPSDYEIERDRSREVIVEPAAMERLRRFHVARFSLATAARMDYHAAAAVRAAHGYGASYQELGNAIGATRQHIQRKYGVTAAERHAVAKTIGDAVATLDRYPIVPGAKWSPEPIAHNVSTESNLSAALVTLEGATVSSPAHVLLFHQGEFLGTATDQPAPGVHLLDSASTDKAVAIEFRKLGTPNAGPPDQIDTTLFRWLDDRVHWFGTLPEGLTSSVARCGFIRYFETMAHAPGEVLKCGASKVHESYLNGSTVLRVRKPDKSIEYVAGTRYDNAPLSYCDRGGEVAVEMGTEVLLRYPAGTNIREATREDLREETNLQHARTKLG